MSGRRHSMARKVVRLRNPKDVSQPDRKKLAHLLAQGLSPRQLRRLIDQS